eukprot:13604685-Heterocapsa_arctica.AAC.1
MDVDEKDEYERRLEEGLSMKIRRGFDNFAELRYDEKSCRYYKESYADKNTSSWSLRRSSRSTSTRCYERNECFSMKSSVPTATLWSVSRHTATGT